MGNLNGIKERHGRDNLKDAGFIATALLLTALAIGSVTSKAAGKPTSHEWKLSVVDPVSHVEIGR
jgi:hypothetical protein